MEYFSNIILGTKSFLRQNWLILFLFFVLFVRIDNRSVIPLTRKAVARASMVATMDSNAEINNLTSSSSRQFTTKGNKISKNLNMDIEVKNIKSVKGDVEKRANNVGGSVDNFYSYEFYNKTAYNFYIKIPVEKLDEFSNYIKSLGVLKSENFSSIDKTDSYTDNMNRLKNLRIRRDSLRKLMIDEAKQVADIISIEKELNNVQMEIERFEKNNQKIQDSVDYSVVNLTITPKVVVGANGMGWDFSRSVGNALNVFIKFCQKFVDYFIILIMFVPLALVLLLIYWFFHRRVYNSKLEK
jgi:hypothetical protein